MSAMQGREKQDSQTCPTVGESRLAELKQRFVFNVGMTPAEFVAVIWDALNDKI